MNNLYDILANSAVAAAQNIFLDIPCEDESRAELTYETTLEKVQQQAHVLKVNYDIEQGDRIAVISPKCHDQILLYYAVWQLGAIIVPVSESLGEDEVSFILADAEPKTIFVHQSFVSKVADCTDLEIQVFANLSKSQISYTEDAPDCYDQTAALIYTSGSTGRPKGVMLSHRNLMVNGISSADKLPISDNDRIASILPLLA